MPSHKTGVSAADHFKHPRNELAAADELLRGLATATHNGLYEARWRSLLNHLEKSWIKLERSCQPVIHEFASWQTPYKQLRKTDPLLRYLKAARDADAHSIQDLTKFKPGETAIRAADPTKPLVIDHMRFEGGKFTRFEGRNIAVNFTMPSVALVDVTNRGETY